MTTPHPPAGEPAPASTPNLARAALWVAIGALIAAALVCVVWVLFGPENGIIARAFLTILLLASFAGVAMLDANLAPRRPAWFALSSIAVWVVVLLIGAFLIWMPSRPWGFTSGVDRTISFLLIVLVLQLALLHLKLYTKAATRYVTGFTQTVASITIGLVVLLAVLIVTALTLHEWVRFPNLYWRIIVAVTILAALGTALIPLLNALFAPKAPKPAQELPPWPTYVDGVTPLPVMPDGSPDWNAYYTGYPTYPQYQPGATAPTETPQSAPAGPPAGAPAPPASPAPNIPPASPSTHPGYEGYPPPPPLPPR